MIKDKYRLYDELILKAEARAEFELNAFLKKHDIKSGHIYTSQQEAEMDVMFERQEKRVCAILEKCEINRVCKPYSKKHWELIDEAKRICGPGPYKRSWEFPQWLSAQLSALKSAHPA